MRFVLRRSGNPLLILRLGELPVLPQHYWKDRDFRATTFTAPLGSGPYRIVEVDPGRRLVFERVKAGGRKLPVNRGKYNFDRVVVDFYRDNGVAFEAFKAGEFDFYIEHQAKNWLNNYRFPAVLRGDVIRTEIPHQIPSQTQALFEHPSRRVQGARATPGAGRDVRLRMDQSRPLQQFLPALAQLPNSEFAASGVPEARNGCTCRRTASNCRRSCSNSRSACRPPRGAAFP